MGIHPVHGTGRGGLKLSCSAFSSSPSTLYVGGCFTEIPGTNSYEVSLEGSTNLANWVTTTNGYFTNDISAMFFRIRSTRLP